MNSNNYLKQRYSNEVLQLLSPREEKIIKLRYGLEVQRISCDEIARYFAVSTERVLQILVKAEAKVNKIHSNRTEQL